MRIGFVGAGKVGCSLAMYLNSQHCEFSGFYSKTEANASEIANRIHCRAYTDINELAQKSDLLFFTVPDDSIATVYQSISQENLKNTIVCHCSGSLTAKEVFGKDDVEHNIRKISLHPLCAVDSKESHKDLARVFFFMEGDSEITSLMREYLTGLKLNVRIIDSSIKTKYHLAASVVSNQVIALIAQGIELLEDCGFSEEDSLKALSPLISGNIEHILDRGPVKALTGPVQRGDISTVKKHLDVLASDEDKLLYTLLSRKLLKLAKIKNPDKDFNKLEKFLTQE